MIFYSYHVGVSLGDSVLESRGPIWVQEDNLSGMAHSGKPEGNVSKMQAEKLTNF